MIKALLLDLDGTLLDDRSAMAAATAALYEAHRNVLSDRSLDEFAVRWRELSSRHWQRYVAGELDFSGQQRERVREALGRPLSDAEADAAFASHLTAYENAWRCYDDVADFLSRTKMLPKIALTNGQRQQQRYKMERTGLLADVPDLVTPEDAGAWKPEPGIFHYALRQLGVTPEETMMIGDDHARDILPAEVLGLKSFWVRRDKNGLLDAWQRIEMEATP